MAYSVVVCYITSNSLLSQVIGLLELSVSNLPKKLWCTFGVFGLVEVAKYSSACVRQLKSRKGKPWQCILKYKDDKGNWKQITKVLPKEVKGKKEAQRLLRQWQDEMETIANKRTVLTTPQEDKGITEKTVREAVLDELQTELTKRQIQQSTFVGQLRKANSIIFPFIGDIPFTKLTSDDIEHWQLQLAEKYKPNTIHHALSIVNKTYKKALKRRDIQENPFNYVDRIQNGRPERINYLDADGRKKFITCCESLLEKGGTKRTAFLIAYYSGLRMSEICGLQWQDVNLALGVMWVRRAIGYKPKDKQGNMYYVKEPKTPSSKRDIPLMPQLIEVFKEREEFQKKELGKDCLAPNQYILTRAFHTDTFASLRSVRKYLENFVKANEIKGVTGEYITFHALRHTFATVAVSSGMDVKSLSSILGHSNAAMTLNIYASSDQNAKALNIKKLSSFLEAQSKEDEFGDFIPE